MACQRILLALSAVVTAALTAPSVAEVYQWQDEAGKVHFSDTPPAGNVAAPFEIEEVQGFSFPDQDDSVSSLERTAKQLKKDRISRQKSAEEERKRKQKIHQAWQKKQQDKKKHLLACAKAQQKADAAFRQRMQRTSLKSANKAMDKYEKARARVHALCD